MSVEENNTHYSPTHPDFSCSSPTCSPPISPIYNATSEALEEGELKQYEEQVVPDHHPALRKVIQNHVHPQRLSFVPPHLPPQPQLQSFSSLPSRRPLPYPASNSSIHANKQTDNRESDLLPRNHSVSNNHSGPIRHHQHTNHNRNDRRNDVNYRPIPYHARRYENNSQPRYNSNSSENWQSTQKPYQDERTAYAHFHCIYCHSSWKKYDISWPEKLCECSKCGRKCRSDEWILKNSAE